MSLHPRQLGVTFVNQHCEPTSVLNIAVGTINMQFPRPLRIHICHIYYSKSVQRSDFYLLRGEKANLFRLALQYMEQMAINPVLNTDGSLEKRVEG